MDKVLKRKKDDSMYDSRYIELEKLMNIINKLNKEEEKYIENLAEPIDNPKLKAIIAKLGKSVFNKNKNKK